MLLFKTWKIFFYVMKKITNKKDVSLSNNLVASKFHLTREEQNLVLLVASQISKHDEDFKHSNKERLYTN